MIMIVEDHVLNMKLLNDVMQASGYDTVQVYDGRDVLARAREHRPDLILMDIRLPGMSGLDVTRALKSDHDLKATPVVAVTALAMRGDEQRARAAGCDAYVIKPVAIGQLLAVVRRLADGDDRTLASAGLDAPPASP